MKWTESATKHWSTRTAVSNTEILSPLNKYTFWTASIWHGMWHIHIWKVLQSRSYCIGCISPLSHCVDALHSRPTHMQSSIWWLHSCIAQLHTLNTVLIAQCRVQLSAHYAQLYHALPGLCTLPCSTLPSSFDQKSGVISAAATAHSFTGLTSSCIKSGFLFSLFGFS